MPSRNLRRVALLLAACGGLVWFGGLRPPQLYSQPVLAGDFQAGLASGNVQRQVTSLASELTEIRHDVEEAMHGVEWDTLLFFAALFVMVEGLAEMGLIRAIAEILSDLILEIGVESRQPMAIVLVTVVSSVVSAFVDNIPYTTTMVPVIRTIADEVPGVRIEPCVTIVSFDSVTVRWCSK